MNRKELFLNIYNNIKSNTIKYYVPIIRSNSDTSLDGVFNGTERLFFLENGLYFISETVIEAYKMLLPKNLNFVCINENQFNLILEDICMKQLPTKPIALVVDDKTFIVEKSSVLVNWIDEEIEDKVKDNISIKYIDNDKNVPTAIMNNSKISLKEKVIVGSIVTILILLKVLFLYVSYVFSFNVLALTSVFGIFITAIVFIFLNTLGDIATRGILDYITKK